MSPHGTSMLEKRARVSNMSSSDHDALALAAFAVILKRKKFKEKRAMRRKDWLLDTTTLYPHDWHDYLRMDETYLNLSFLITPLIKKHNTITSEAITPHERLNGNTLSRPPSSVVVARYFCC